MKTIGKITALSAFALAASSGSSFAAIVTAVENMPNTSTGTLAIDNSVAGLTLPDFASVSFTTSAEDFELTSAAVKFNQGVKQATNVAVELWSTNTTSPGPEPWTKISDLSGASTIFAPGAVSFTGSVALTANTTYWLVVSGVDVLLDTTGDPTESGVLSGWKIGDVAVTYDASAAMPAWVPVPISETLQIEIKGNPAAVPEPSSTALLGLGSLGLLLRRKRKS